MNEVDYDGRVRILGYADSSGTKYVDLTCGWPEAMDLEFKAEPHHIEELKEIAEAVNDAIKFLEGEK